MNDLGRRAEGFNMRPMLLGLALVILLAGCGPTQQFPTLEQNAAARTASLNDKQERIVPDVLAGMWVGDKGSVLSFGPDHQISYRVGSAGATDRGTYKLEGFHLFLDQKALGYVSLSKPDKFFLATSRKNLENFRKVA